MFSVSTGQTGILIEVEKEGEYSLIVNVSLEEAYELSKELVRSAVMYEMRNPTVNLASIPKKEEIWEEIKVSVPEAEAVKNALKKIKDKEVDTEEVAEEDEEDPFKEDDTDEEDEEEGIEIPAPKPKAEPVSVPVKNGKDKKRKK